MAIVAGTKVSSQGVRLRFGLTANDEIDVISISTTASAEGEIDITGMNAHTLQDNANTGNKVVIREVDYGVIDLGEIQVEFFGPSATAGWLGMKRQVSIVGGGAGATPQLNTTFGKVTYGIVTNVSTQIVAGDLVKGTLTLRLSNS